MALNPDDGHANENLEVRNLRGNDPDKQGEVDPGFMGICRIRPPEIAGVPYDQGL